MRASALVCDIVGVSAYVSQAIWHLLRKMRFPLLYSCDLPDCLWGIIFLLLHIQQCHSESNWKWLWWKFWLSCWHIYKKIVNVKFEYLYIFKYNLCINMYNLYIYYITQLSEFVSWCCPMQFWILPNPGLKLQASNACNEMPIRRQVAHRQNKLMFVWTCW